MTDLLVFQAPYVFVFLGSICLWILSDLWIVWRNPESRDVGQDRGSKRVIGLAVSGGVLGAILLPELVPAPRLSIPGITFWLGVLGVLAGVVLRQYAVRTLGERFSLVVHVEPDDDIVCEGPYRWVRHPSYAGALLTMAGAGAALGTLPSFASMLGCGFIGYGYRIRVEERALCEQLGDRYDRYAARTRFRLIPGIW